MAKRNKKDDDDVVDDIAKVLEQMVGTSDDLEAGKMRMEAEAEEGDDGANKAKKDLKVQGPEEPGRATGEEVATSREGQLAMEDSEAHLLARKRGLFRRKSDRGDDGDDDDQAVSIPAPTDPPVVKRDLRPGRSVAPVDYAMTAADDSTSNTTTTTTTGGNTSSIAAASTDTTADPPPRPPGTTSMNRNDERVQQRQALPGAYNMGSANNESNEAGDLVSLQVGEQGGEEEDDEELMLNATLVEEGTERGGAEQDNNDPELLGEVVEAKPALEGYQALIQNKLFRGLTALLALVVLAVVIPVSIVIPKQISDAQSSDSNSTTIVQTNITTLYDCGTERTNQADYRGTIAVSRFGLPCIDWDADLIGHGYTSENFPNSGLDKNYCRNPIARKQAWCYVNRSAAIQGSSSVQGSTDGSGTGVNIWQFCDVPFCDGEVEEDRQECGSLLEGQRQEDYRGTISVTNTGRECQRWDAQFPHDHSRSNENYPGMDLEENYCRNPDGESMAWCYTVDPDVRWEYCAVPICELLAPAEDSNNATTVEDNIGRKECFNCTLLECGRPQLLQHDYRGFVNITQTGIPCQRWDEQEPHEHTRTSDKYPDGGLSENYCRNPDGMERAWVCQ